MGSERRSATPIARVENAEDIGKSGKNNNGSSPAVVGIHYSCDSCFRDISHVVRVQCAVCDDVDLCVECFGQGVEFSLHLRQHDYRLLPPLTFAGYTAGWRIDEELLFLEALETNGLGNWQDISEHVGGGKTLQECLRHFLDVYLPQHPLEAFQRSIEGRNYGQDLCTNGEPSLPAMHEIAGYMPLRDEFEMESPENDFEAQLKDFCFSPDDDEHVVENRLKLTLLKDIYAQVLRQRQARHWFVRRWNLLDFRRQQQVEKARSKEDRDVFSSLRPLSRFLPLSEFERLHRGLAREDELKRRIAQLQEYRRHGLRSLAPSAIGQFEQERKHLELYLKGGLMTQSLGPLLSTPHYPLIAPPSASENVSGAFSNNQQHPSHSMMFTKEASVGRKASTPLNISNADGVDLLSDKERHLCSILRLYPRLYLHIKDVLIREHLRLGGLKRAQARAAVKIDVNKTSKLYDFFTTAGWIRPPESGE